MDRNKSAHKLKNFGPVYYLNLDEQPERKIYMEAQFKYWEIENYTRISAYDGRDDMLYEMLKQGTAKYITRHKRDWIHVHDVVRAICYLIPDKFRGVLDIGTGTNYSVLELAKRMGRGDLPIKEDTPGEPDSLCADITQLTKLGWFPTIDIMSLLNG